MSKYFMLLLALFMLWGCGSSKKTQSPPVAPQPSWVANRPTSPTYYYGIGAARKTHDVSQYQQAARQNALADMAGEISISISSNSVLHAFESSLNFREDFTSTIRAQTQQDLEGYELVDSWEDQNNYWVFYRLSKEKHRQLVEQRKNNAATRSLDFFSSGINAREAGNIRLALVQLVKALEPIKPYFSEPLPVDFQGKSIYLGNEIFKELSNTISSTEINPKQSVISIKSTQGIPESELQFVAQHRSTGIISDLPLLATYSEKPIRNNRKRTASNGLATFEVDIVRSSNAVETFSATIDMENILAEAGSDPFIRRLVSRFSLPQGTIRINVEKPIFHIISIEANLGEVQVPGLLEEAFRRKAIEMGYIVSDDTETADYLVRISAATSARGESGQFKNVSLEGVITVDTNNGVRVYHKPLEGFMGRHFEYKEAGDEAFREARRRLEVSFFREIHEAIGGR